jgi:hypothetical protein
MKDPEKQGLMQKHRKFTGPLEIFLPVFFENPGLLSIFF